MKGYEYIQTAPIDDVVDALAPSFDTSSKESIKKCIESYKRIDAWVDTPVMTLDAYNRLITIMTEANELDKPIEFEKIVDNTIAEELVKELNNKK